MPTSVPTTIVGVPAKCASSDTKGLGQQREERISRRGNTLSSGLRSSFRWCGPAACDAHSEGPILTIAVPATSLYLLLGRKSFLKEGTPSIVQPHMRPTASSSLYHPLDEILGTPALVRVLRVLAGHGASLGVSDIARRTRLALPSTRAALRRLLEAELVTGVGAGRSMVCALRMEHPLASALTALFVTERQQADTVLDAIRIAAAELRPRPLAVWLYGSVARGEDTPVSDVDIAMVSAQPEPSAQADALREAIATTLQSRAQRVSVIAFAPADVRRLAAERAEIWTELVRDAAVLIGDDPAGVLEHVSAEEAGA